MSRLCAYRYKEENYYITNEKVCLRNCSFLETLKVIPHFQMPFCIQNNIYTVLFMEQEVFVPGNKAVTVKVKTCCRKVAIYLVPSPHSQ